MIGKKVKVMFDNQLLGTGVISDICETKSKVDLYFLEDHPSIEKYYDEINNHRKVYIVDFNEGGSGGYIKSELF